MVPQLRYGYGRALITTNIFRYVSYYALWKVPVREPDRSALFSIPSRQQRSVLRSVRNEQSSRGPYMAARCRRYILLQILYFITIRLQVSVDRLSFELSRRIEHGTKLLIVTKCRLA